MSNGNYITNRDLYDAIERLESKLSHRIERVEQCVDSNTDWRNQLTGKLTVIMIVVGAAINFLWDQIFNRP